MSNAANDVDVRAIMERIKANAEGRSEEKTVIPEFVGPEHQRIFNVRVLERCIDRVNKNWDVSSSFSSPGGNPVKRLLKKICDKWMRFFLYKQNAFNDGANKSLTQLYNFVVESELRRCNEEENGGISENLEQVFLDQERRMADLGNRLAAAEAEHERLTKRLSDLAEQNGEKA